MVRLLRLDTFLAKYNMLTGDKKLTDFEDFGQWRLRLPDHADTEILCCPEDHRCLDHPDHADDHVLHACCELPVCRHCQEHLVKRQLPPLSLANDMWSGYAPDRLYSESVTVVEMICASPCITSLICMSMEARYRSEHEAFDEKTL
eukprot:4282893-Amphidinium_carterae.2